MATILIADDRPANREFLVTLLGYGGHRLLEAADGAEALAVTRAEHPDLVITDVLMPVVDGYEFVRQLRADPAVAATRVLFYTAHYHEDEVRGLAAAVGVSGVLAKPCEPDAILAAVAAALAAPPAPVPPPGDAFDRDHLRVLTNKLAEKVDALNRSNARLTTLVELGLRLGSEREPGRVLQAFCDAARELVTSRAAVVGIPVNGGPDLRHLAVSGFDPAAVARIGRQPPVNGVLGTVLRAGRSIRLNDPDGMAAAGVPPAFLPVRSLLAAPIVSPARVHGWVCVLDRAGGGPFTDEDERLVGTLAATVGRIYENGSLYADLVRQAADLAREIGDRKRAEAEERRVSALFRAVVDGTTDAVFAKDRDGKYLLFNPAAARLTGATAAEVLGRDATAVFEPDSARFVMARDRRVMATGQTATGEETLTAKGVTRTYLATVVPHRNDAGDVVGVLGVAHDITDRKRAEAALHLRDRAIRAVAQGIVITDATRPDEPIVYVSPGFERLTGYPAAEALGKNCRFLQGPGTDPAALARVRAAVAAGTACVDELLNYRKDGTPFWNELSISPVLDDAGRRTHFVGVMADATGRRALEDQYRQAQKMEAVGRLAGGIAHDFNNLLTIINGYGDLVLGLLPDGDPLREHVGEIVAAGERATGLTRQLLAFSRKSIVEPAVLDLAAVVGGLDIMLRRILGEDIELVVAADPGVGSVRADAGQIEQVILNLVVNARDAMPRGGRLTIEVRNAPDAAPAGDSGRFVRLAVADTGTGMDAATIARAFEPFFTTKGEHGTGLGLATVHGIVTQAGGRVRVASTVGAGTRFEIDLPRVDLPADVKPPAATDDLPRGTETVLVVEDEDGVRALTRRVLEMCGYTVLECRDGDDAVRLAADHAGPIDLLVTDVVLPRIGGGEVAARLAAARPGVKVLFVSGYTDDAVVRHGISESEVGFLQKPFTPHALATKVRAILDES